MTDLDDDYYIYDETSLTLTGKNSGKIYSIGDTITVKVKSANTDLRQIDYVIIKGSESDE